MRILLDQNIPREITSWLKAMRSDWEVTHASDIGLATASDRNLFTAAQDLQAVIFTYDEDFTDRRLFDEPHAGIVRLNVWPTTVETTQHAEPCSAPS